MSNCICPECIIHGKHQNLENFNKFPSFKGKHRSHEAQTIKKAYPIVKSKVEDILSGLVSKLDEIKAIQEKLDTNRHDTKETSKNLKKQLADIFNVILYYYHIKN